MNAEVRAIKTSAEQGLVQAYAGARGRQKSTERARKAVYNRLRQAIQHIEVAHAELAGHLVLTIKTGTSCVYRGEQHWQTSNN